MADERVVYKRDTHVHGSFPHYYVERGGANDSALDPRIRAMRPDFFNGRRCLDIGCHQGNIAIAIAKRWCCASMVGIDIDEALVARARSSLAYFGDGGDGGGDEEPAPADSRKAKTTRVSAAKTPGAASQPAAPVALAISMGLVAPASSLGAHPPLFPRNVQFRVVDATRAGRAFGADAFETILCLSTSKWVHLNGGDQAIIALFEQVHRMLADGGIFVLEPQPWVSYRRKKHVSDVARENYARIKLRPEQFPAYLLDYVGFRACEEIRVEYDASVSKGFANRPLYLFIK